MPAPVYPQTRPIRRCLAPVVQPLTTSIRVPLHRPIVTTSGASSRTSRLCSPSHRSETLPSTPAPRSVATFTRVTASSSLRASEDLQAGPSCSVHAVSHRSDGFLRERSAGLLHPAAGPEVRRVSSTEADSPQRCGPFEVSRVHSGSSVRNAPNRSSTHLHPRPLPPCCQCSFTRLCLIAPLESVTMSTAEPIRGSPTPSTQAAHRASASEDARPKPPEYAPRHVFRPVR